MVTTQVSVPCMPELRGNYVNEWALPAVSLNLSRLISYKPVSKAYEIQGLIFMWCVFLASRYFIRLLGQEIGPFYVPILYNVTQRQTYVHSSNWIRRHPILGAISSLDCGNTGLDPY
jgi:hypothetical protein